jgi:P pilus assembly chaperone PapD
MSIARLATALGLVSLAAFLPAIPARAEIVLSELIVELQPGKQTRDDIEVWNKSPDRAYVAVEPREILNPSLPSQSVRRDPDPEKLGLLVSPTRMILEPGQRKLLRLVAMPAAADREHVYRVTVKPVVGKIEGDSSGLKLLVGYDVLVLVRPAQPAVSVSAKRSERTVTFNNGGNVSVELVDGRQCQAAAQCTSLPGKRLYPGAAWTVELPSARPAEYTVKSPGRSERRVF